MRQRLPTGGYGGYPFTPGAHGKIAAEDLIGHLHAHVVHRSENEPDLLYIDLHVLYEGARCSTVLSCRRGRTVRERCPAPAPDLNEEGDCLAQRFSQALDD
ncbi:hypothetical protein H4696_001092 [Amycolatopsis lexingtonensis]|uniref:Uncharacterized protein n=1 Tax=Amycolatopsis lexingtonensis TaxID=218822 RepID=A0ABR9HST6_9PSEU|nr:hypothetical protein [Amycolatopsis lexingtonensis]MBE1493992.1 hypothetical protein [Amycolatopsis lexingtonensis]